MFAYQKLNGMIRTTCKVRFSCSCRWCTIVSYQTNLPSSWLEPKSERYLEHLNEQAEQNLEKELQDLICEKIFDGEPEVAGFLLIPSSSVGILEVEVALYKVAFFLSHLLA